MEGQSNGGKEEEMTDTIWGFSLHKYITIPAILKSLKQEQFISQEDAFGSILGGAEMDKWRTGG